MFSIDLEQRKQEPTLFCASVLNIGLAGTRLNEMLKSNELWGSRSSEDLCRIMGPVPDFDDMVSRHLLNHATVRITHASVRFVLLDPPCLLEQ